jgi:hypothetical protein
MTILRQRQMGDTTVRVGGGDRLMNDTCRLRRRSDGFGVERDVAEQKIGLGRLDVVDAMQLARHVARLRQDWRVVAASLTEPGDQTGTAGAGGAGTDSEVVAASDGRTLFQAIRTLQAPVNAHRR